MKKTVVSVSLGSKNGDFVRETVVNGVNVTISREGTDGDMEAAKARICQLDGVVDAIGLGGIDIYLYVGDQQLIIGDGMRLHDAAKVTPVVDGSGLKNTLERRVVKDLFQRRLTTSLSKVLMVCALDRFGMAEAFVAEGCDCVFGDLIFNIGLDFPLTKLSEIKEIAQKYRTRLLTVPFHLLYPTGAAQDVKKTDARYAKYYESADIIAGDAHLILRHMPEKICGKGIVTNTTRPESMERFALAGAAWVMTTTPNLSGISGGTNVMEATLVALMEKPVSDITPSDYSEWTDRLGWHGSLTPLSADSKVPSHS
jgi:hypothetical protein